MMKEAISNISINISVIFKVVIVLTFFILPFSASSQESYETIKKTGTVFLNPGHGGRDVGLLVDGKVKEKDITLGLARKITALNTGDSAYSFVLSRQSDVTRNNEERISMVNGIRPSAYVSLHVGASFDTVVRGIKIYTWSNIMGAVSSGKQESSEKWWKKSKGDILGSYKIRSLENAQSDYLQKSKQLAESIRNEVIKISGIPCTIENAPVMELGSVSAPAVSIEILQSSNETDRNMILNENTMAQIAGSLFIGAEKFISEQSSIGK